MSQNIIYFDLITVKEERSGKLFDQTAETRNLLQNLGKPLSSRIARIPEQWLKRFVLQDWKNTLCSVLSFKETRHKKLMKQASVWSEILRTLYSNSAPSHVSYFINVNQLEDAFACERVRMRHWL